jgi:hypothetical protein
MELLTKSDIERFFAKIEIPYDNMLLGCWEWNGNKNHNTYGRFGINYKLYGSHRISYLIFNKKFPDNFACHTCDNPGCVNPLHLWDGTAQENVTDMIEKGRDKYNIELPTIGFKKNKPNGIKNIKSKLTEEQVIDIRNRKNNERGYIQKISDEFNVNYTTINKILRRLTWTHI